MAFVIWQVAHIAHAGAAQPRAASSSPASLLGVGEGGGFPGGIKAVTEWFPKKERALATGIFNAGTNIGAIITPLVIPAITLAWRLARWPSSSPASSACSGWSLWLLMYRRPREQKRRQRRRAGPHRAGPGRPGREDRLVQAAGQARDLGLRPGQVPDRPDLVDVAVLAARLLRASATAWTCRPFGPLAGRRSTCSPTSAASAGGWLSSRLHEDGPEHQLGRARSPC